MRRHISRLFKVISVLVSFTVLGCLAVLVHLVAPGSSDENWSEVAIPEGASYTEGISILEENGIIENGLTLLVLGKITGADRQLKSGYYQLSPSMSQLRLFDILIEGRTIQYTITIPEGSSLRDIKRRLEARGLVDEISWQLMYDREFLDLLDIEAPTLEGYVYPDTYNFPKGIHPRVIFKVMVQRMREVFDESLRARADELGMTENEVLTLASIIEKEAVYDSERPLISAVYHNRLEKGMKLQADPTVLYGVKKRWKRIRYRDLKKRTPYNTYVIKGLPRGPICSPGRKSIEAALYPADVDYLFFVAMNNGRHFFSTNGEDHMKAVQLYQVNGYNKAGDDEEEIN